MTDEMWTIAEYAGCAAIGLGFFGWLVMLAYLWVGDRDRRPSRRGDTGGTARTYPSFASGPMRTFRRSNYGS